MARANIVRRRPNTKPGADAHYGACLVKLEMSLVY
jgi:hypothetical protein